MPTLERAAETCHQHRRPFDRYATWIPLLEHLPVLDFRHWWFARRSQFAEITNWPVVAAKTNLLSGFNLNPLPVADCAQSRDGHAQNSTLIKWFLSLRSGTPAQKKTTALIRRRFSISRGDLLVRRNYLTAHPNQKHPSLIQGTLPLQLAGCQTPFSKSFLMLGQRVSNSVWVGNNNSDIRSDSRYGSRSLALSILVNFLSSKIF
jgi:hypothetical protein